MLITRGMGGIGDDPTSCKLGKFFQIPLTLTMPIGNNFQLNEASGETPKTLDITMKMTFIVIPKVWVFLP